STIQSGVCYYEPGGLRHVSISENRAIIIGSKLKKQTESASRNTKDGPLLKSIEALNKERLESIHLSNR
ncbi:unnamed protein product, partial [Dovyalis caffra]